MVKENRPWTQRARNFFFHLLMWRSVWVTCSWTEKNRGIGGKHQEKSETVALFDPQPGPVVDQPSPTLSNRLALVLSYPSNTIQEQGFEPPVNILKQKIPE